MGIALLLQTPKTRLFIVSFVEFGGGGAVGGEEELTSASLGSTGILGNQSQPASQPFSGTFWTLKLIVSSEGRVMSIFHGDTQKLPTCLGIAGIMPCSKEVTVDATHLAPAHRELSVNCLLGSTV